MNQTPHEDAVARSRFFIIAGTRLFGTILVVLGILVVNETIAWPPAVGYVLLVIGLIDAFVMPQILVRKWRSPRS